MKPCTYLPRYRATCPRKDIFINIMQIFVTVTYPRLISQEWYLKLRMTVRKQGQSGMDGRRPLRVVVASLCCMPYDRSISSSRASSPHCVIQCFLFQFPVSFLLRKVTQQVLTSSSSSSRHLYPSLYISFNNVSQSVINPHSLFLLFVGYFSPPSLPAIHFISHTIDPTDLLYGITPPDLTLYVFFFKIRGMLCW